MTTNPDLDLAREWAQLVGPGAASNIGRAAAEVIAALPDEWIDADKLRDVINGQLSSYPHGTVGHHVAEEIACKLEALFPAPQPRTLADLLAAGHAPEEYQWMQARLGDEVVVITKVNSTQAAYLRRSGTPGVHASRRFDQIAPLPDLPRMVWPDEHYPTADEDVSIIPPKIDTSTGHDDDVDMTPEDAPDGYYLVRWWGEEHPVPAEKVQGQWWVIGKPSMLPAKDVLIVSRLIPEVKA